MGRRRGSPGRPNADARVRNVPLRTPDRRPGAEVKSRDRRSEPALPPSARARAVIAAAVGPLIAGYAVVAALLALVTSIASVATFSVAGVLRAAATAWLAAYQVPVVIAGRPLGVLPLLATIGMCSLVARSAAHAVARLGYDSPGQAVNVIVPIAAAHALFGVTVAALSIGSSVSAEPLTAFLVPGFLAGLSAIVGVARCCGLVSALRDNLDTLAIRGLRAGAVGLAGLLAAGAFVYALNLGLSTSTAGHLFAENAHGFGSSAGMLLLCLGYLPNAVVFALSFAAGPGFSIGSVSVGAFSFSGGAVPGVPLLAGVPEHAARWWPVLMLLPALVGALVGWSLRDSYEDPRGRLRTVGIAGAMVGFGCVLLGSVAGGRLGSGPFNPVAVPVGLTSLTAFGWIVLPGGLVAWLAGPRTRRAETGEEPTEDAPAPTSPDPEEFG